MHQGSYPLFCVLALSRFKTNRCVTKSGWSENWIYYLLLSFSCLKTRIHYYTMLIWIEKLEMKNINSNRELRNFCKECSNFLTGSNTNVQIFVIWKFVFLWSVFQPPFLGIAQEHGSKCGTWLGSHIIDPIIQIQRSHKTSFCTRILTYFMQCYGRRLHIGRLQKKQRRI